MFNPPTPHFLILSATVPHKGLRAKHIGSKAGFNAVPQPSYRLARSVTAPVKNSPAPRTCALLTPLTPIPHVPLGRRRFLYSSTPTTGRSCPLSNALPTSRDF